ncbi:transporter substrate-binding domain-containing protein [Scatolibacter rhodanostii]|uniref:transporter substrate-binding domain-containing protein n=1 Tax=Scatolibacter rhodanostii TaxID=2014781 RepID=UPI0013563ACE|nr:transporter substrate-binding domain-containing protein [Scatolibacter rhodanostii]
MKKTTKALSLFFALLMVVLSFAACSSSKEDWEYIENRKKMVIGYTLFQPMNYKDDDGKLVGFDTEFAEAVCAELAITPEFVQINWDTKTTELKSKKIDAIWNGFTVTEERKKEFDFSVPYVVNKQVAVVKKERADEFKTIENLATAKLTAETKSAGESAIQGDEKLKDADYISVEFQTDALLEVKSGTSDVAVIDYTMAKSMLSEGSDYSDLMIVEGLELSPEEYAVGFRKDSPVTLEKVNAAIETLAESGKLGEIAAKYNLGEELADNLK